MMQRVLVVYFILWVSGHYLPGILYGRRVEAKALVEFGLWFRNRSVERWLRSRAYRWTVVLSCDGVSRYLQSLQFNHMHYMGIKEVLA
jgi:hypothetical protein